MFPWHLAAGKYTLLLQYRNISSQERFVCCRTFKLQAWNTSRCQHVQTSTTFAHMEQKLPLQKTATKPRTYKKSIMIRSQLWSDVSSVCRCRLSGLWWNTSPWLLMTGMCTLIGHTGWAGRWHCPPSCWYQAGGWFCCIRRVGTSHRQVSTIRSDYFSQNNKAVWCRLSCLK